MWLKPLMNVHMCSIYLSTSLILYQHKTTLYLFSFDKIHTSVTLVVLHCISEVNSVQSVLRIGSEYCFWKSVPNTPGGFVHCSLLFILFPDTCTNNPKAKFLEDGNYLWNDSEFPTKFGGVGFPKLKKMSMRLQGGTNGGFCISFNA